MSTDKKRDSQGIWAALSSALFLGLAPIFGKQAILLGFSPLAVVALRTSMAAGFLLILVTIFKRSYLFIYPAGFLGCCLAGAINGTGSILYYLALERLTVSIGQLLYSLYPVFILIWFLIDRQRPSWLTYFRLIVSLGGVVLLTATDINNTDWYGIFLMLCASLLYALHLPINQKVLYDIPAPTVTLYTLLSMSVVTVPVFLLFDPFSHPPAMGTSWGPIICLTLVTFLSRLSLFLGIKRLGGIQTALLGLGELLVSILVSFIWLDEKLSWMQWFGAALLFFSLLLIGFEKFRPDLRKSGRGILGWLKPPDIESKIPWGVDK